MRNRRAFIPVIASQASAPVVPPFDPDAVPNQIEIYDFSDVTTVWQDTARTIHITASDQTVGGATDKSGANNHLASTDAGSRPLYKTNIQNSLSAAFFDGDNLATEAAPVAHGIGTGDFYVITVAKPGGVNGLATIWSNGNYSPCLYFTSAGALSLYWGGYKTFAGTYTADTHIIELFRESGVVKLIVDGVQDANEFILGTSMGDAISVLGTDGASDNYDGHIMEHRFFNALPSESDRSGLRSYLDAKWINP